MAERQQRMSRPARTARGAVFAFVSTVLAAASHALAGGAITPVSMAATAIMALPLCVALAGRVGSLWRVGCAVGASQFFYHWVFSGIGGASAIRQASSAPAGAHASHMASLERFVPAIVDSGAADTTMWILHGVAAIVSTALIARGERSALAILRTLGRALHVPFVRIAIRSTGRAPAPSNTPVLRHQLLSRFTRSLRGPPVPA